MVSISQINLTIEGCYNFVRLKSVPRYRFLDEEICWSVFAC